MIFNKVKVLEERINLLEKSLKQIETITFWTNTGYKSMSFMMFIYQLLTHLRLEVYESPAIHPYTGLRRINVQTKKKKAS